MSSVFTTFYSVSARPAVRSQRKIVVMVALLLLTAVMDAPALHAAERVTVQAELRSSHVPLNRTVSLSVRVAWNGAADAYDVSPPEFSESDDFHVVGSSVANEVTAHAGRSQVVRTYIYRLKPVRAGTAEVPPLRITYKPAGGGPPQTLETQRLRFDVSKPARNGLGLAARVVLFSLSAIGIALLCGFALRRRQSGESPPSDSDETVQTPSERLLDELNRHKSLRIAGDFRGYCNAVAASLRRYLADTYDVDAMRMDTDALMARLPELGVSRIVIQRSAEVLGRCDLAKFAAAAPQTAELDELQEAVREIAQAPPFHVDDETDEEEDA